jgi:Uma2 family endonuclease
MATAELLADRPDGQHFLLHGVDWETYCKLRDALRGRHLHLTYDRGSLELMTLSLGHEWYGSMLGRFIETLTLELGLPLKSAGSTTLDREDLERGAEPDRCYYLEHEPLVREKEEIDLTVDPPPDLALEIDVSRSSIKRLGIYAALKIPEVWRFNGERIWVISSRRKGRTFRSNRAGISLSYRSPKLFLFFAAAMRWMKIAWFALSATGSGSELPETGRPEPCRATVPFSVVSSQ